MGSYEIALAAEEDLDRIFDYTIDHWGIDQAKRYRGKLKDAFDAIASDVKKGRMVAKKRPEIRFLRVEHHYVFYLAEEQREPLVVAVFHEKMDLIGRLERRLGGK